MKPLELGNQIFKNAQGVLLQKAPRANTVGIPEVTDKVRFLNFIRKTIREEIEELIYR